MEISGRAAVLGDKLSILISDGKFEELVSIAIQILREVSHRGRIRIYDTFKTRYLIAQLLEANGALDIVKPETIGLVTRCVPLLTSLEADSMTFILTDFGRKALAELTEKYHD